MLRFLWWLVAVPVGIAAVALAVANRRPVALALDPFATDPFAPGAALPAIHLPFYLLIFGVLVVGVLVGGVAAWMSEGRNRRELRRWRAEARRLEVDLAARDAALREQGAREAALPPPAARLAVADRRVA
jgi:uncharacterized integral membrane protein